MFVVFFPRKQEEDSSVSVPTGPFAKRGHEGQHLVGGQRKGNFPVLLQTQRGSGTSLGSAERQSQEDDLPENGQGIEKLRQDRRGQKDQEEAHIPVQW